MPENAIFICPRRDWVYKILEQTPNHLDLIAIYVKYYDLSRLSRAIRLMVLLDNSDGESCE